MLLLNEAVSNYEDHFIAATALQIHSESQFVMFWFPPTFPDSFLN